MSAWREHVRIHVEPGQLTLGNPAIAVVPANQDERLPLCRGVVVRCACGIDVAAVRQHEASAYVIVTAAKVEVEE